MPSEKQPNKNDVPPTIETARIPRLTLSDPVTITGTGPLGFDGQAQITLSPTDKPGWFWKTQSGEYIEINLAMLKRGNFDVDSKHFLYFEHNGEKLKIVEHLLPLRFLGLDSVVIEAPTADAWVPYDGGGELYWESIEKKIRYDGFLEPLKRGADLSYSCDGGPNGSQRTLKYEENPDGTGQLQVTVVIDYPKFQGDDESGKHTIERTFPVGNPNEMHDIIVAPPLLKPEWLENVVKVVAKLGWEWPHIGKVLTSSDFDPQNPEPYLRQIALHRMLDLLGAYAVATEEGGKYLTGYLHSVAGNHASDISSLKELMKLTQDPTE